MTTLDSTQYQRWSDERDQQQPWNNENFGYDFEAKKPWDMPDFRLCPLCELPTNPDYVDLEIWEHECRCEQVQP